MASYYIRVTWSNSHFIALSVFHRPAFYRLFHENAIFWDIDLNVSGSIQLNRCIELFWTSLTCNLQTTQATSTFLFNYEHSSSDNMGLITYLALAHNEWMDWSVWYQDWFVGMTQRDGFFETGWSIELTNWRYGQRIKAKI